MKKWFIALIALAICLLIGERLYREGIMLYTSKKNNEASFIELKKAAEKGNRKAQYRLAHRYDKGHGIRENDCLSLVYEGRQAR